MFRIKGSDEAIKLFERYEKLMKNINEFKKTYFHEWASSIPKIIHENTNDVVVVYQSGDIVLNFSPQVRCRTIGFFFKYSFWL